MKNQLPVHEWIAVLFVSSLVLSFGIVSYLNTPKEYPIEESVPIASEITIYIDGAVLHPGAVKLPKDTRYSPRVFTLIEKRLCAAF